ncbi:unnamed protein product [Lepidochelys kempii]
MLASWAGFSFSQSPCSLLQARGEPLQPLLSASLGGGEARSPAASAAGRKEEGGQGEKCDILGVSDGSRCQCRISGNLAEDALLVKSLDPLHLGSNESCELEKVHRGALVSLITACSFFNKSN